MVTEGGRGEAVDDAAEEVEEVMVVMRVRVKTTVKNVRRKKKNQRR